MENAEAMLRCLVWLPLKFIGMGLCAVGVLALGGRDDSNAAYATVLVFAANVATWLWPRHGGLWMRRN